MGYEDEVTKKSQELLTDACKRLGLQGDVKIISRLGHRWTLEYEQSPDHTDFAMHMIQLEKMLQFAMRRPVDLRLPKKNDKNKRFDRNYLRGVEKLEVT